MFLIFQTVSLAGSSKKLTQKEKEIFHANIFTKENFPCYSDTEKPLSMNNEKLCGYIVPTYLPYLLSNASKMLVDKSIKFTTYDGIYPYLEYVSGLKTYTKEYNYEENISYFNPEMIQWVSYNFYDKPDGKTLGVNNKDIYNSFFKENLREYARVYVGLKKRGDFDKKVEEYKESLKKDPYSGVDFTDNFTITLKLDIKSEPREYEDYRIVGFWLRRGIDGTEKVSWSSLRRTMEDYDKEWFKSIQN